MLRTPSRFFTFLLTAVLAGSFGATSATAAPASPPATKLGVEPSARPAADVRSRSKPRKVGKKRKPARRKGAARKRPDVEQAAKRNRVSKIANRAATALSDDPFAAGVSLTTAASGALAPSEGDDAPDAPDDSVPSPSPSPDSPGDTADGANGAAETAPTAAPASRPGPAASTLDRAGRPAPAAPGSQAPEAGFGPFGEGQALPGETEFNRCNKFPKNKRILKFNFRPESPISDLIGWISSISCIQFLIPGQDLSDRKVTILSPEYISAQEAYRLFMGALDSVGLTVEPMGRFLRVVESGRARSLDLPFYAEDDELPAGGGPGGGRQYVTRMFRFDHLEPQDVLGSLYSQFKGEQGSAVAFGDALIVTDRASLVERFERIVREVDVPTATRERIWLVRIRNASATEMAARLSQIFAIRDGSPAPAIRPGFTQPSPPSIADYEERPRVTTASRLDRARAQPTRRTLPTVQPAAMVGNGSLTSQLTINKLIPNDRTNQLIVVANEQAYAWLVAVLKKIDLPLEDGGDGRFHVYHCRNASCDELAATLSAATGVSVAGTSGGRPTAAKPGSAAPPQASGTLPGDAAAAAAFFEGEVRVTYAAATNALVIHASLRDFQALRRVIEKLDAPRKQVFVEAMILEVLLDKSREIGVSYHGAALTSIGGRESLAVGGFGAGQSMNPAAVAGDLTGLAGGLFGPALEAAGTRLFGSQVDIPSFGVLVKILQKNNDVNVLSNPHLLITNNEEGEISVGQRLPFPSGLIGGAGLPPGLGGQPAGAEGAGFGLFPQVAVSREDVSLRMKLVPSVNEENTIRMDVDVEISDLAAPNFNGLGPATSKRTARTPIFCKDQQTVIIGGLMSDRATEAVQKVPILGDIPLLGALFRSTAKQIQKSNIIIALTPYVISDTEDLRRIASKKMRERREFMERFTDMKDLASWEPDVDYGKTRGMLEVINRTARLADEEESALRRIRERELMEEDIAIEPPAALVDKRPRRPSKSRPRDDAEPDPKATAVRLPQPF